MTAVAMGVFWSIFFVPEKKHPDHEWVYTTVSFVIYKNLKKCGNYELEEWVLQLICCTTPVYTITFMPKDQWNKMPEPRTGCHQWNVQPNLEVEELKLQRWQRSLSNDINPGGLETSECLEGWSYSHWDPPTINRASLEKYSKIPAFRVCFRFCCTAICCQPQFHLLPHLPAFHPNSTTFHGHLGHHWNLALMQSQGFQASEVETKRSISQCLMLPAAKW